MGLHVKLGACSTSLVHVVQAWLDPRLLERSLQNNYNLDTTEMNTGQGSMESFIIHEAKDLLNIKSNNMRENILGFNDAVVNRLILLNNVPSYKPILHF